MKLGIQSGHEGSAHASGGAAFRLKCCYRASLGPCGIHKRNEVAIALLLAVFLRRRQCYLNRGRLSWYGRRMGSAVLAAANPSWSRNLRVGRGSRESRSLIGHSSPLLIALQNVVNGGGSAAVMPSNTRKGFTPANSVPQWRSIRLAGFWPSFSWTPMYGVWSAGRASTVNANPRMI